MPFVQRTVQPVHVSRRKLTAADGRPLVQDNELEAVFNGTLCCAIRQLASLLEVADDLFGVLQKDVTAVTERASALHRRVKHVQELVDASDPKLVTVPEGDLSAFAALPRDRHFRSKLRGQDGQLFLSCSRPDCVQRLYDAAAPPTLDAAALEQLDRLRRDGARSSTLFLCTPVLGLPGRSRAQQRMRRKVADIDIETRKPASFVELRRWTSTEALGDVTVHPDCTVRIASGQAGSDTEEVDGLGDTLRVDQTDHQLPTTEEQVKAIADRFPPEVVKVDVSGRSFVRMTQCRRSLIHPSCNQTTSSTNDETRRRTRPRRQRSRRRNTIAGTDQKEIEEALNGDRTDNSNTLTTVDDIILSSSSMLNSNTKETKETSADFKKWAFNSLRRWGRSRLRAISSINSSASSNIVSGELHAADPVDDINVYETVAGKRRGAGNIPISAGLSGPMSLAVKLRESSLGQRRLKINDEPPHSSSGNWSASSESGRASVNSDSSHQPKSSTCSSILPHRRRFINNSTSSSVTSEGTLTPEDMAAAPFLDDGETSSAHHPAATQLSNDLMDVVFSHATWKEKVYSCDTEGYYTSFHMDSGLKTLKEEETGAGFSLPPTPMHSTSALSNCSSGRGSASLAQLTAESEYELFGKGSTSTTASSAGTVCTTLLVDNSKGGDNSHGSDRSLSKAPAVPERKSSLSVPCLGQECPPCSKVVALIHNTSQDHSPCSLSGDSPDSGHNTSSSPVDSVSCPQDTETDALISPIPSITSEMEFSECSDFEGTDRIERIRVKTTINTSRIPSMCAISPPQSDDETSLRHFIVGSGIEANKTSGQIRAAAPLPNYLSNATDNGNRIDNQHYSGNGAVQMMDDNANRPVIDNNINRRSTTPVTRASLTSVIHVDGKSGYATVQTLDNAFKEDNNNQRVRPPSPSGGTLFINTKTEEEPMMQLLHQQPFIKDALIPFTHMLNKFRKATPGKKFSLDTISNNHHAKYTTSDLSLATNEPMDESGEYVTITDVRNNNNPDTPSEWTPQCSEATEPACESSNKTWESLEYVSLNELPAPTTTDLLPSSVLSGSSNESSLERKKRQGARVTLDSEGKVVYSSDSLRRRKGAHTTFAPGQYVKDPSEYPSSSTLTPQRTPKAIIRPVQIQASEAMKSLNVRSSMKGTHDYNSIDLRTKTPQNTHKDEMNISSPKITAALSKINESQIDPQKASNQSFDSSNQRSKVIIRAGVSSPTKDLVRSTVKSRGRCVSPRSVSVTRGAYVHVQPNDQSNVETHPAYLQTDFDGPEDPIKPSLVSQLSGKNLEGHHLPLLMRESSNLSNHNSPESSTNSQNQHVYQNVAILRQSTRPEVLSSVSHSGLSTSQAIDAPLHSSTPTKCETKLPSPLSLRHAFSPIEKDVGQPLTSSNAARGVDGKQGHNVNFRPCDVYKKTSLISVPRTSMTSEELYAKIHKSKKQMNIKYEPEIVLSSSPSVCGSQSPAGSERSVSPGSVQEPRGPRSRHSWSPNSSKYVDVASKFDSRSSTPPSQSNPKKNSDHGLTQVTSTYDFKRLLLQHGSGTSGRSKLSAVERLKQAKQAATNVFTSNAPRLLFGAGSSSSSAGSINAGAKSASGNIQGNLQSSNSKPTSGKSILSKSGPKSAWRFAGQTNDVRSTPIFEDHGEDEQNHGVLKIQTLSASPMPARNIGRIAANRSPNRLPPGLISATELCYDRSDFRDTNENVESSSSYVTHCPVSQHAETITNAQSDKQQLGHRQNLPHSKRATDGCQAALETAL